MEASIFPTIKELEVEQLVIPITTAISNYVFVRGHKPLSEGDLDKVSSYVISHLKSYFTTYRVDEIVHSFEMGAKGLLSDENDMNVVSPELFLKFPVRYNDKIRQLTFRKQREHEEKLQVEKEMQKKAVLLKNMGETIINVYNSYCQGKELCDILTVTPDPEHLMSIYFQFIEKRIDINEWVSNLHRHTLFAQAKEEVMKKEPSKREDFRAWNIFDQTKESRIRTIARSKALDMLFEEWNNIGYELKFE